MSGRRRLQRSELRDAALLGARIAGCTCEPDIDVTTVLPGLHDVIVGHDDWCELHRRLRAETN